MNRRTARVIRRFERFDANAIDGDGDGLVQEGTQFQRPATAQQLTGRMVSGNRFDPSDPRSKDYDESKALADVAIEIQKNPSMLQLSPDRTPTALARIAGAVMDLFNFRRLRHIEPVGHYDDEEVNRVTRSMRIEMADDGIAMLIADPPADMRDLIPTNHNYSHVRVPNTQERIRIYEALLDAELKPTPEGENIDYLGESSKAEKWFNNNLRPLITSTPPEVRDKLVADGQLTALGESLQFDELVERHMRVPSLENFIDAGFMEFSQFFHDVLGHIGTGRGFDRHGEFANFLAMVDVFENLHDGVQKDYSAFYWLRRVLLRQLETWEKADEARGIKGSGEASSLLKRVIDRLGTVDGYIGRDAMREIFSMDDPKTYAPKTPETKQMKNENVNKRALAYLHSMIDNGWPNTTRVHDSFGLGKIKTTRIQGKSLRRIGNRFDRFDPNAIDGDNDGIVQEGTNFERPATPATNLNRYQRRLSGRMVKPEEPMDRKPWSQIGPKIRKVTNEETYNILKAAYDQGFKIDVNNKNHPYIEDPTGRRAVASGTPSDWRSTRNFRAEAKRLGVELPDTEPRKKRKTFNINDIDEDKRVSQEALDEALKYANEVMSGIEDGDVTKAADRLDIDDLAEILGVTEQDKKDQLAFYVNSFFEGFFPGYIYPETGRGQRRVEAQKKPQGKQLPMTDTLKKISVAAKVSLKNILARKPRNTELDILKDDSWDSDIAWATTDYVLERMDPRPGKAADAVIVRTGKDGKLEVLMIGRKSGPFTGAYALPGGFVDEGETFEQAAIRETLEEVGIPQDGLRDLRYMGSLSALDWDPRTVQGMTVGAIVAVVKNDVEPKAGSDARNFEWVPVDRLAKGDFNIGFGHARWLAEAFRGNEDLKQKFDALSRAQRYRNREMIAEVNARRIQINAERKKAGLPPVKLFSIRDIDAQNGGNPEAYWIVDRPRSGGRGLSGQMGIMSGRRERRKIASGQKPKPVKIEELYSALLPLVEKNPGIIPKAGEELLKFRAKNNSKKTAKKFGISEAEVNRLVDEYAMQLERAKEQSIYAQEMERRKKKLGDGKKPKVEVQKIDPIDLIEDGFGPDPDDEDYTRKYTEYLKKMMGDDWFGPIGADARSLISRREKATGLELAMIEDELMAIEVDYFQFRDAPDEFVDGADDEAKKAAKANQEWLDYLDALKNTDPEEYRYWRDFNPVEDLGSEPVSGGQTWQQLSLFDDYVPMPKKPESKKRKRFWQKKKKQQQKLRRWNKSPFLGIDRVKEDQAKQLQQFRTVKKDGNWRKIHDSHFDWWTFPIDRGSMAYGDGYNVAGQHHRKLKRDAEFISNLKEAMAIYAESLGWDIESSSWLPNIDWDNYQGPDGNINGARLYKIVRSAQVFGLQNELESLLLMIASLRTNDKFRAQIGRNSFWENPDVPINMNTPKMARRGRRGIAPSAAMERKAGEKSYYIASILTKADNALPKARVPSLPIRPSGIDDNNRSVVKDTEKEIKRAKDITQDEWYEFYYDTMDNLLTGADDPNKYVMQLASIVQSAAFVPSDSGGVELKLSNQDIKNILSIIDYINKTKPKNAKFSNLDAIKNGLNNLLKDNNNGQQ